MRDVVRVCECKCVFVCFCVSSGALAGVSVS